MTTSKQIIRIITEVTDYITNSNPYVSCNKFSWNYKEIEKIGVTDSYYIELQLLWDGGEFSWRIDTNNLTNDYINYVIYRFKHEYDREWMEPYFVIVKPKDKSSNS